MHNLASFHVSDILTEKKAVLINLLAGGGRQHPISLQRKVDASKGTPGWPLHSSRWTILISTICRLSVDWCLPGVQLGSCLPSRQAPRDSKLSALPGLSVARLTWSSIWKASSNCSTAGMHYSSLLGLKVKEMQAHFKRLILLLLLTFFVYSSLYRISWHPGPCIPLFITFPCNSFC